MAPELAGGTVDPVLLVPGTRVLFWWHDDAAKKMRVLDGEVKKLEENGTYVIEDPDFIYDIKHKDIIRIREGLPHGG